MNTGNFLKGLSSVAILVLLVFLCFAFAASTKNKRASLVKTIQIENPAKTFCTENGGDYIVISKNDESTFDVCNFDDGSSCKAGEFFTQKCKKGFSIAENKDFGIMEISAETCDKTSTCKLPNKYVVRSDCAYQTLCIENKCAVICPSTQKIETVYCEKDAYDLSCICKEGKKQQVLCPENMTCPAVVQFECVK